MSELSDFRDGFNAYLADANGGPAQAPPQTATLPPGHFWTPHVPKAGPFPPRRRAPASSEFADLFAK